MKQKTNLFLILTLAIFSFLLFQNKEENKLDLLKQKIDNDKSENPIERAEYEFRMLKNPTTGKIPLGIRKKEVQFVRNILSVKEERLRKGSNIEALNFKSRGPVNRGGRVRALGMDMRSTSASSVIIAAGVSGSIWRSTDNGASWVQTSLPSQLNNASCITQDRRVGHQDTWYVGTGEFFGNSARGHGAPYRGDGIFKSTDNGQSWAVIPSTVSGTPQSFDSYSDYVISVAVNPNTGSIFYGSGINTIRRSNNNGNNWQSVLTSKDGDNLVVKSAEVFISEGGIIYATIPGGDKKGVWSSNDDGDNWTDITPTDFPANVERAIIAVAPSDANRLYLLAHAPGSGLNNNSIWRSDNGGTSWINKTTNLPDSKEPVVGLELQGAYNMTISVKPDDPNFVVFGGTNLFRTTDGFTSKIGQLYANWIGGYSIANNISEYKNHHPDQHALVFAPFNSSILFSGNDGGVQVTSNVSGNVVSWKDINNGFITSQFYSIAMDQATSGNAVLLGGLQDNGNYFVNSENKETKWVEMIGGGDGGFTAIANGRDYYYIETQYGHLIRLQLYFSGDYKSWTVATPKNKSKGLFINPYVLDPNDSKMMYFIAGDSLWRNSDLTAIPNSSNNPTSLNWSVLSNTTTGNMITAVAASKNPANIVYYGSSQGGVFKLNNANVGDPVPVNISNGKGMPKGYISSIAIDPNNANNVFVTFSNYEIISLYYTSDGGDSWTAVAGNLEEHPDGSGNGPSCRWGAILNNGSSVTYFVATSAGLYSTSALNGMATTWLQEAPNKIGVAVCTMVKTRQIDGKIAVATHGAGVYSAEITTDIKDDVVTLNSFELSQNYPNPFNPTTTINYSISKSGLVTLKVFNVRGEIVAELINKEQSIGKHSITFNASNLASGTYIYKLNSNGNQIAKKMVLIK